MFTPNHNRARRRRSRSKAHTRKQKLFGKVICQKDYLSCICVYLTVQKTFASIPAVSRFHYKFLQHCNQKHLIYQLLSYETWGKNVTITYSRPYGWFRSPGHHIDILFLINQAIQIIQSLRMPRDIDAGGT